MANKELNARIIHKRDTAENWSANNPVLLNGEFVIVDTDDGKTRLKIGDGTNDYNSLSFVDDDLINMIGAINAVPLSTTNDNDKILSVVDGVPTWVAIDSIITI